MLKEVWLNIGIEKVDIYKDMTVKVLLDSGITEIFMNKKIAAKHGFKLQKLNKPVMVRNVDGTNNSRGAIMHQVEVNMYYKSYVKRIKMNVCDLRRTNIILGMPWLQAHNPKINQEIREVKITRYSPICKRKIVVKEDIERKKKVRRRIKVIEKSDRNEWKISIEKKFDKVKLDKEKVRKIVLPRFHKQLKVFEKAESEKMSVRKPWDHMINLRKDFIPRKGRTYLMQREEKEEVREFVKEQLRKGYIRSSKSPQTLPVFFVEKRIERKEWCRIINT